MVLRTLAPIFAVFCLIACVQADTDDGPDHFEPPTEDAGSGTDAPVEEPPTPDGPVQDCINEANYTDCLLPDQVAGFCIIGECVKSCIEDVECDDADPCTRDVCFWGHCDNGSYEC